MSDDPPMEEREAGAKAIAETIAREKPVGDMDTDELREAIEERRQARREARDEHLEEEIQHEDVMRYLEAEEVANPENYRDEEPWD